MEKTKKSERIEELRSMIDSLGKQLQEDDIGYYTTMLVVEEINMLRDELIELLNEED